MNKKVKTYLALALAIIIAFAAMGTSILAAEKNFTADVKLYEANGTSPNSKNSFRFAWTSDGDLYVAMILGNHKNQKITKLKFGNENPVSLESVKVWEGSPETNKKDTGDKLNVFSPADGTTFSYYVTDLLDNYNDEEYRWVVVNLGKRTLTGSFTLKGLTDNGAPGHQIDGVFNIHFPLQLTITANSLDKPYDGTPLLASGYSTQGLLSWHSVDSVSVSGSQTDAGASASHASDATILDDDNNNVTAMYSITYKKGSLTVTEAPVTIEANSKNFTYNGSAQSDSGYDVQGLMGDDEINAVVVGSITYPGQSPVANEVTSYSFIKGNPDNYNVTIVDGQLTMDKVALTIKADSEEWVYDGNAHSNDGYTITSGSLISGDVLSVVVTGSITDVDEEDNVITAYSIIRDGVDVTTSDYSVLTLDGKLKVTPLEVTINADDADKIYDGTPLTKDSYTHTALVSGHILTGVTVTGTITDVGEEANVPSGGAIMSGDEDVTDNYTILYADGKLEVTSLAVTITVNDADKTVDEADPAFTGIVDGLIDEGDLGEISFFRTNVDEEIGTYAGVLDASYTDNPNYVVTVIMGDFEIKAKEVVAGDEDIIDDEGGEKVLGDEDTKTPATGQGLGSPYLYLGILLLVLAAVAAILGKRAFRKQD